jgi:hypothetical protein
MVDNTYSKPQYTDAEREKAMEELRQGALKRARRFEGRDPSTFSIAEVVEINRSLCSSLYSRYSQRGSAANDWNDNLPEQEGVPFLGDALGMAKSAKSAGRVLCQ